MKIVYFTASNSAANGQSNSANNFAAKKSLPSSSFIPKNLNVFDKPYDSQNNPSISKYPSISKDPDPSKTSQAENKQTYIGYWQHRFSDDFRPASENNGCKYQVTYIKQMNKDQQKKTWVVF